MLSVIAAHIAEFLRQDTSSGLERFDQMNRCIRWAIISYLAGISRSELDLLSIEVFYRVADSLIHTIVADSAYAGKSLEQRLVTVIQQFEIDDPFCHLIKDHSPLEAREMTALAKLPMTLLEFLVQADVAPPSRLQGAGREAIIDFFTYLYCVATFSGQDVLDTTFINETLSLEDDLTEVVQSCLDQDLSSIETFLSELEFRQH